MRNEKRLQNQVHRQKIENELLRKKPRQVTNQLRRIKRKLMDYNNAKQPNLNFSHWNSK